MTSLFQDVDHQTMKQSTNHLTAGFYLDQWTSCLSQTHMNAEVKKKKKIIQYMVNDNFSLIMHAYQVTVLRHNTVMDV